MEWATRFLDLSKTRLGQRLVVLINLDDEGGSLRLVSVTALASRHRSSDDHRPFAIRLVVFCHLAVGFIGGRSQG
jgi:hypothetical protein